MKGAKIVLASAIFLLAGWMMVSGALMSVKTFSDFEEAKTTPFGSIVCQKQEERVWSGTAKLEKGYRYSHGLALSPLDSPLEDWTGVKVNGRFIEDESGQETSFENGELVSSQGSPRLQLHPGFSMRGKPGILELRISHLPPHVDQAVLRFDLFHRLCGCEMMILYFVVPLAVASAVVVLFAGLWLLRLLRLARSKNQNPEWNR